MSRRPFLLAGVSAAAGLAFSLPTRSSAGAAPGVVPGQPAPSFEVVDATGQTRTLAEFKGKTVVLEWSSSSCPFAVAQYKAGRMPELQRWATGQGIVWLTILSSHPSRSDYLEPAKADAFNRKRGGAPSALLIDASGTMGRAYGAATANHMFVIAPGGALVYTGGIDDSQSMNTSKIATSHNHVRAALEDLLAGRRVATEPFGCALAYAG